MNQEAGEKESNDQSQRCVIEPRRGKAEAPVPPGVLMGFTSQDLTLIRKSLGVVQEPDRWVDSAKLWGCPSPWDGVAIAGPAVGAPVAVLRMERLIAFGARFIIGMGSCGSLQPDINIGQVIIPTGALVEEGTSAHYQGPGVSTEPDSTLVVEIRQALNDEGIQPREGRIWTTDAPFRETVEKVRRYQQLGILAVEMEASALMTVASFRGVSFASVLVVSDEIGALRWKRGFDDARYLDGLSGVARVTVQVLAQRVRQSSIETSHGETQ